MVWAMRVVAALLSLLLWSCADAPETAETVEEIHTPEVGASETRAPGDSRAAADTPAEPQIRTLIDNTRWTPTESALDPFFEANGAKGIMCPPEEYGVEELPDGPWFDVKTRECGYLTVEQPILEEVPEGATLRVRVWHFAATVGQGTFYLAMAIGEPAEVIWEGSVEVPTDKGGLLYDEFITPRAMTMGETAYWHISNHGDNTWGLIEFSAEW